MKVRKKSGNDIRYSICKCAKCGIVRQCTPDFDFYKIPILPGKLLCEDCFKHWFLTLDGDDDDENALGEVLQKHSKWDGKSPHPYGCDGLDDE